MKFQDEYEYEDEDIHDSKSDSEEDPKVIKELLDLIKKAGLCSYTYSKYNSKNIQINTNLSNRLI